MWKIMKSVYCGIRLDLLTMHQRFLYARFFMFTYAQTNQAKGETRQVPKQRARYESTLWFPFEYQVVICVFRWCRQPCQRLRTQRRCPSQWRPSWLLTCPMNSLSCWKRSSWTTRSLVNTGAWTQKYSNIWTFGTGHFCVFWLLRTWNSLPKQSCSTV